jgi:hypothetical protein
MAATGAGSSRPPPAAPAARFGGSPTPGRSCGATASAGVSWPARYQLRITDDAIGPGAARGRAACGPSAMAKVALRGGRPDGEGPPPGVARRAAGAAPRIRDRRRTRTAASWAYAGSAASPTRTSRCRTRSATNARTSRSHACGSTSGERHAHPVDDLGQRQRGRQRLPDEARHVLHAEVGALLDVEHDQLARGELRGEHVRSTERGPRRLQRCGITNGLGAP